jgi:outer membrane protein assembly factor BamD (BamD/ComL family)
MRNGRGPGIVRRLAWLGTACAAGLSLGCMGGPWGGKKPAATDSSTVLIGANGVSAEVMAKAEADMTNAETLYRHNDYDAARKAFRDIADNTHNPAPIAEKARYFEAECFRQMGKFPKAADTYHKMLIDFPAGTYREQAVQRMYDIANFWLDDTRAEIAAKAERDAGQRWIVWPNYLHVTDPHKPTLDEEGRALQVLEQVHYSDITGPMADRALFMAGKVHFINGDYREADHFFTQLVTMHKDSPLVPQALELAIIAKNHATGGSDYDGRKAAEALELVHTTRNAYPEVAKTKGDFLDRQIIAITYQQAEKAYKTAQYYERTHHKPSAYFEYEVIRRRFPNTKFAQQSEERMEVLRKEFEESKKHPYGTGVTGMVREQWDRVLGKAPPTPEQIADPGAPPQPAVQQGAPAQQLPAPRPIPQDLMNPH